MVSCHGGGPTIIIDQCESAHRLPRMSPAASEGTLSLSRDESDEDSHTLLNSPRSNSSIDSGHLLHNAGYGSLRLRTNHATAYSHGAVPPESIRFQVVVWDVGPVDVALGRVPMTFRVTMFWDIEENAISGQKGRIDKPSGPCTEWSMAGRRKAYERLLCDETIISQVDVPPISLLNVVTFDVIGQPEVCVLRENKHKFTKVLGGQEQIKTTRLMRWTCLYKATLLQHNMRLDTFPHDEHVLSLKVGVLTHRKSGGRWDMNQYSLDLATEEDSQHSTRIPHGLIVDHARVPDFKYNAKEGLDFQFVPLSMGLSSVGVGQSPLTQKGSKVKQDSCLEVRLRVVRDSGYYDQNIMPLIVMLNIVAVAIPISMESTYFFQRGLLLLNLTFVQIGIRMNVDKLLPSVGYQIKMQRIMNEFFFSLLFLVLESSLVFVMNDRHGWTVAMTDKIDIAISSFSMLHIFSTSMRYYWDKLQSEQRLEGASNPAMMTAKAKKQHKEPDYLPV